MAGRGPGAGGDPALRRLRRALRFTGTFVGVCVQDLGGTRAVADFDWFELRDLAP
ncbi:hypothetical protein ABZ547_09250 [Streptomyces sparsogenes]|uniref:beta-xylosidase family glycoside hydrolase n=1 Tax=Streptomyces sparsogenes TaxID=67365 RepID=UPI0034035E3C